MHRGFITMGALLAAIAVGLGAFGAHGLKAIVPAETVSTFETGVRYQMYHSFAILLVGILYERFPVKQLKWSANFFLLGIVLFSGSLYGLTALKATASIGLGGIGIVTPFGGLCFIVGWILIVVSFVSRKDAK